MLSLTCKRTDAIVDSGDEDCFSTSEAKGFIHDDLIITNDILVTR
jgi:hypothetical protein